MLLNILQEPNPALHKQAEEIPPVDVENPKTQKLVADMIETMYERDGVGLAATQAGKPLQLCIIAKQYNILDENKDLVLVNPKWEKSSILKVWDEEGCLSVADIYGKVRRYRKIKVSALDEKGRKLNFSATDFFARVIQHEVDHLQGILFIEKAKDLHEVEKEL
ncbi:peptide deformylase [Patescibacteria group bacterium]|nr:peptide deformylase [Patescibacteria group bacterium]